MYQAVRENNKLLGGVKMIPSNFVNSWFGYCRRVSPDARWCVTHESPMDNGSECAVWKNYVEYTRMIMDACREDHA